MTKLGLQHIALYAKDWYVKEQDQDIWSDLKIIFDLDGYNGEFMTKTDIVSVLLSHCQKMENVRAFELFTFANGISQSLSFKFGYYTKGCNMSEDYAKARNLTLPEWDYQEAIVRYCISTIKFFKGELVAGEGIKLPRPNYDNLPRPESVSDEDLDFHFGETVKGIEG